jgi:hypothetical protein
MDRDFMAQQLHITEDASRQVYAHTLRTNMSATFRLYKLE